jgi:hypothetical protein
MSPKQYKPKDIHTKIHISQNSDVQKESFEKPREITPYTKGKKQLRMTVDREN